MKKEIGFLLGCLAVLGIFLVRTLQDGRWFRQGLQEMPGSVADPKALAAADVYRVEIRRPKDIVTFTRAKDGAWKMANPVTARPDEQKILAVLELLAAKGDPTTLRIPLGKSAAQQETALANFGMGKPRIGIVFDGAFGQQTLWLGDPAPEDQGVYARWVGAPYIQLVGSKIYDIASASAQDFRERRIFHDPKSPIEEVALHTQGQTAELLCDGKALYRMSAPGPDGAEAQIVHRADPAARQEILAFLETLRAKEFWDAEPQVLSRETMLKLRLIRAGNARRAEETWLLEKLSTVRGEKWMLSSPTREERYVVDPNDFAKYCGELRWILSRKWTDQSVEDCRYLSFTNDDQQIELLKGESGWTLRGHKQWPVDQAKVQGVVENLLDLQITDFVACREVPARGCTEISLGKSASDTSSIWLEDRAGTHWIHPKGDSFQFSAQIAALDIARCTQTLFWRDSRIFQAQAEQVCKVEWRKGKARTQFAREHGQWKLVSPLAGDADEKALGKALEKLLDMKAVRFVSGDTTGEMAGFSQRLNMEFDSGLPAAEICWGQKTSEGVLAKLPKEGIIFVAPSDVAEMFLKDPIVFVSQLKDDYNSNGKIDQWIHYRAGQRAWMETDDDEDGKVDTKTFWRYGPAGALFRMDTDTSNDGLVDQRTYFYQDRPYRQEDDTDGNGNVDVWTSFVKGVQARQRLDSDNDGRPDTLKKIRRDAAGQIVGADVYKGPEGKPAYQEKYQGEKVLHEGILKTAR